MKTKDGYEYKLIRASFKQGRPKHNNKQYIQYEDGIIELRNNLSIKLQTFCRYESLVYGIGINDSTPSSNPHIVEKWRGVLRRTVQHSRGYTCSKNQSVIESYTDVKVCEEWCTFSNFERWLTPLYFDGCEVDKDLLGNGKVYSPDTCCVLPHILNSSLVLQDKGKSSFYGVQHEARSGKYVACKYLRGKSSKRKRFDTEEDAHHYWQQCKADTIDELVEEYLKLDMIQPPEVAQIFKDKSNKLRYDSLNKNITSYI